MLFFLRPYHYDSHDGDRQRTLEKIRRLQESPEYQELERQLIEQKLAERLLEANRETIEDAQIRAEREADSPATEESSGENEPSTGSNGDAADPKLAALTALVVESALVAAEEREQEMLVAIMEAADLL